MTKEKKNVIWNILGASFNAFNSLFFTIIVTRVNGLNDAGIFTYSFATACLLYNIGIYEGRTFQVTDITGKHSDSDYLYNKLFTCIIMIIVAICFTLIKGYDIYKVAIFLILNLFRCVEAFAEGVYAVIQKNGNLYKVGISLFVKALLGIIVFAIIDIITKNLILASSSLIVVNLLGLLFYDRKNLKEVKMTKTKFSWKANTNILKIGFFTFILTFLGIYLINAPRYAIDDISTNDLQTIFGIIIMPATFMGLLGQYIIQPLLTKIANFIKNTNYKELKSIIIKIISIISILGMAVFVIAYVLEVPVLQIVYGIELKPYFVPMMIIIVGSIFYSISIILSAILIAMRKTLAQAIIYGICSIAASVLSYKLVEKFAIQGASITYTVTMFTVALAFAIYLIYNMKIYKEKWKLNENINNNSNI